MQEPAWSSGMSILWPGPGEAEALAETGTPPASGGPLHAPERHDKRSQGSSRRLQARGTRFWMARDARLRALHSATWRCLCHACLQHSLANG